MKTRDFPTTLLVILLTGCVFGAIAVCVDSKPDCASPYNDIDRNACVTVDNQDPPK